MDFVHPWMREATDFTNGNFPFLLGSLLGVSLATGRFGSFGALAFLLAFGLGLLEAMRRRRTFWLVRSTADQVCIIVFTAGLFLVFSKKSYAMYYAMIVPFLIVLIGSSVRRTWGLGCLMLQGSAGLLTNQIWSRILGSPDQMAGLLFGSDATRAAWLVLGLDGVMVCITLWCVVVAWREISGEPRRIKTGSSSATY